MDPAGEPVSCKFKGVCANIHPHPNVDLLVLGPEVMQDHFNNWRCNIAVKKLLAVALGQPHLQP